MDAYPTLSDWAWRSVVEQVRGIYTARTIDELLGRCLRNVRSLVPTDILSYSEVGATPAQTRHWIEPDPVGLSRPDNAARNHPHLRDHPVFAHHLGTGDLQAYRITDFVSQARFERTNLYDIAFRPTSVRTGIVTFLEARAPTHVALGFQRDTDYTDEEVGIVRVLRPHFASARQNILALEAARQRGRRFAAQVTPDFVHLTHGVVREFAGRSRELLATYFDTDEERSGALPESVGRWLTSVERSLRQRDGPARPLTPLRVSVPGRQLVVRPLIDVHETILLLEERITALDQGALAVVALTKREREVLFWIADGDTAREVAARLGVSTRTVHKHLEHIYAKTGVTNRVSAIREAMRLAESARGASAGEGY